MKYNVIVIDGENNNLLEIQKVLGESAPQWSDTADIHIEEFSQAHKALGFSNEHPVDVAIISADKYLPAWHELLLALKKQHPEVLVVIISDHVQTAECQRLDVYDCVCRALVAERLPFIMKNCLKQLAIKSQLELLKADAPAKIIGEHESTIALRNTVQELSHQANPVLMFGEHGTGKALVAYRIHMQSERKLRAFVKVDLAHIAQTEHETLLFGRKGHGSHSRRGFFEAAHNGTIYLNEIGHLSLIAQANLMRVLESHEIQKVDDEDTIPVNVRVVASTGKDLSAEVADGRFRADLYDLLHSNTVTTVPLRERVADIPYLVSHLVDRICAEHGLSSKSLDAECMPILQAYSWPGNVLELKNTLERMLMLGGERLTKEHIPFEVARNIRIGHAAEDNISLREFKQRTEREFIIAQLRKHNGNISRLARSLEVDRTNLHKKMTQLDIKREKLFS